MISSDSKSIDVLVAGATGMLGREVIRQLAGSGLSVRAMVRDPLVAPDLVQDRVELVEADVRDPDAVHRAVAGTRAVISTLTGFARGGGPEAVDHHGNHNLMDAAMAVGVERLVLTSIVGSGPDHPSELYRAKYMAERDLMASRLVWTVLRPTVLMETWVWLVGDAVARGGTVRLVGGGDNPINFVSVRDVAGFAKLALTAELDNQAVDIGGPEDLTLNQVIALFEEAAGRCARVSRAPIPVMRTVRAFIRPFKPGLGRILEAAIAMAVTDMKFDAYPVRQRYPLVPMTPFREVAAAAVSNLGSSALTSGSAYQSIQPSR